MSIREMRKRSKTNLAELTGKLKENSYSDDRYWQPTVDKAGNGQATIRFLPESDGEDTPWVKLFSHGFKHNNVKWVIENCPTTNGLPCPICDDIAPMWNSEDTKPVARERKRKTHYITNIMVINDPVNSENNGKVFMYKFGAKIFEKIKYAMEPQFDSDTPFVPFDFWEGANFEIRIVKKDGFRNYDNSRFLPLSELCDGDEGQLDVVWKQQHKLLDELVSNSFDDIKAKYDSVVYGNSKPITTAEDAVVAQPAKSFDEPKTEMSSFTPAEVDTPADSDDLEGYLSSLEV